MSASAPDAAATAVVGGRLVLPDGSIRPGDLLVRGSTIERIAPPGELGVEAENVVHAHGLLVSPGLVDIHTHGAVGHSFDEADASATAVILEHFASVGVTTVQASLVSASPERLRARASALSPFVDVPRPGRARVAGIHLEGPFLAPSQRGAHDASALRDPTPEETADLLGVPGIRMVTLAPERPGATELIRALIDRGIVAAIGHSAAGVDQLDAAQAAGATHLTHLWSGQSGLTRSGPWRVPGLVEASLASDGLTGEVIADGKHLPPALLEIARRCLGERLVVVSDATQGAGMPEGYEYDLGTVRCRVSDGVAIVIGEDAFGGSTTLLPGMLRHLVLDLGWGPAEALRMMTSTPAAVLGRDHGPEAIGVLRTGANADLVVWDDDFQARSVLLRGRQKAAAG